MKKISTLCLTLVMLLMVMMHVAPNAQAAEGEKAKLTYTIVNVSNPNGTNSATVEVTLGNEVGISLGVNEQFGYFVHAGDMIKDASQKFIASASNHVVVVIKESESVTVATFVDTNGEFLGAIYNPTLDSEMLDISVSKPGFNFEGFDDLEAGVDKVYVAKYSRTNQSAIDVIVNGGSKDLEVVKYNDIVKVTPNDGNFSYWADSDGQVVSRQANYTFTALQDVELTAVFGAPASSEPVVYLSNVTGISPNTKSFLGYVEGDFIEYGLLASDKEEVLTLETEDVTVIPSKALHPETNEFLRSIPNDTNLKSFRAYAKLAGGEVYYSDNNYLAIAGKETFESTMSLISQENKHTSFVDEGKVNSYLVITNDLNENVQVEYIKNQATTHSIFNNDSGEIRLYPGGGNGGELKISVTGKLISKITIQTSQNPTILSINGSEPVSDSPTVMFEDGIECISIKNVSAETSGTANQLRITEIEVTYQSLLIEPEVNKKLYKVDILEGETLLDTKNVHAGDILDPLALPAKEGHILSGLTDENNVLFDLETPITKHMTLFAIWTEKIPSETFIETFDGHNIGASYNDTTFTGVGNSAFKIGHSRNEDTYGIDGTGIMLRRASDSYIEITLSNGLSAFSFDYRKAFTGTSERQLEISINGVVVETTAVFGSESGADETVHSVSLTDLTYTGKVVIKIKNVGTATTNKQTTVDNISWTTNPQ